MFEKLNIIFTLKIWKSPSPLDRKERTFENFDVASNLMWKLSEGELDRGEEIKFKSRGKSRWKGPETWKYLGIVLSGWKEENASLLQMIWILNVIGFSQHRSKIRKVQTIIRLEVRKWRRGDEKYGLEIWAGLEENGDVRKEQKLKSRCKIGFIV